MRRAGPSAEGFGYVRHSDEDVRSARLVAAPDAIQCPHASHPSHVARISVPWVYHGERSNQ